MKKRTVYIGVPIIIFFTVFLIVVGGYFKFVPLEDRYNVIATYIKRRRLSKITKMVEHNEIRKKHILELAQALAKYKADKNDYPNIVFANSHEKSGIFSEDLEKNPLVPEYMEKVCYDPVNSEIDYSYDYIHLDKEYLLYAKLEPETLDKPKADEEGTYFCMDSSMEQPTAINFNPFYEGKCSKEGTW